MRKNPMKTFKITRSRDGSWCFKRVSVKKKK